MSYEKFIVFPYDFVDAIVQFCGLPSSGLLRERLIQLIDPNRRSYIAQARRRYDGVIDGVTGGCLYGWCRLTASDDPVELELFVDGGSIMHFLAKEFRKDLLDAGLGSGNHGFVLDVRELDLMPDAIIRIKVAKYGIELKNSGHRLGAYVASSSIP